MKRTGIVAGFAVAAIALAASAAWAMGPGKGAWMRGQHVSFEELDRDGNGEVSKAELEARVKARFDAADADGDGKLTLQEMQAAAAKRATERAGEMFGRIDGNGDGVVTADEMPKPRREARMFDHLDKDGSGGISKEEFEEAGAQMKRHGRKMRQGQWGADQN